MTSSSKSKLGGRYFRLFFVLAFLSLSSLFLVHSARFVNSQAPASNSKSHRPRVSPSPPSPPSCPAPTLQTIYAPTIGLPEIANGRIVFNSRVDTVTDVQPTFYTEEGLGVSGPVVHLQPAEIRYVEIASLIPPTQRWRVRWGGISLSYTGKVFDIWAQITLLGALNSGSSDVTFSVLNGRGSDTQEAVWWMPRGGRAVIALGNSSDTSIHTQLEYSSGDSQAVDIEPHATEYVRLRPRVDDILLASRDGRGESVHLTTVGPAGSLKVAGLVLASDSKLVSSIRFYDTKGMVQQHLFATNLPLRGYQPHIILSNTSDATLVARPRFRPASGEGGTPVELTSLTLQPHEIVELDLNPLLAAAVGRNDLDSVSVEVLNSGAPGTLIGAIFGTSQRTSETFDVPLRDSGINRMNGGAYPWRIDDDYTTVVSINNVGETPSRIVAQIYYQGGVYLFSPRDLAVGETAFFDLKQIREQQLPDANGNVLPRNVSIGQFRWHWYPSPNPPHMIGRAAMMSASNGISASYSCMPNCGAYGPVYLIDGNTTVFAGAYETMHTREQWCGASGGCDAWNTNLDGSTVDNTSVASLGYVSTGWMNVNGLSAGDTYWWWTYWYGYEFDNGFDCQYVQQQETGSEPVDVRPHIDSITPSRGLIGNTIAVSIDGHGFGINPTVNAGTGIIVTVNFANSTSFHIDASFAVSSTAAGGNHGVTVTVSGQTSNSMNFFVQIPSSLARFDYPGATNGYGPLTLTSSTNNEVRNVVGAVLLTNQCGVYRNLVYELKDQQGQSIAQPYDFTETFSNYSGVSTTPGPVNGHSSTGLVQDTMYFGKTLPDCPGPDDNESFDQRFIVTISGTPFSLSTLVHISRGRSSGNWFVDVTTTTP